jgi:cell division protein DivIC
MNTRKKQINAKPKPKKKRRKLTPVMKLLCVGMLVLSAYLLVKIGQTVYTTYKLSAQLSDVQAKLEEVQSENDSLTAEKEKLQDPDYVESYARSNYNLSKSGEQIFYLPEDSSKD